MPRTSTTRTLLATALLATTAVTGSLALQGGAGAADPAGAHVAQLRKDISRYSDVQVALAEGFVPSGPCAASPEGGMGLHYVNPARIGAPLDGRSPQVLLYEQTPRGLKLTGAEYLVMDADGRLDTDADRPSLFGQPFDGPMPGHEPGMPVHYDLHVWTSKANPAGVFSPWNRRVSC